MSRYVSLVVLLALAGCGVWILVSGISLGWRIHRVKQWSTTPGTVAELKSDHFTYVYEVAGISHQGKREGQFVPDEYAPGTTVIDFRVEQEDSVYPMVPAGADLHDMIRRPSPIVETADD